ncbi:LacI family DNA-binding transcriptional regulator, partial [Streptomyces sparsus]
MARRVGVSAKTVSRVLNGDGPVAEDTRARVLAAVAELGFRPNLMARNMRAGTSDSTVGLVVPDMGNPFFGTVAGAVEAAVRQHGLTLLVGSSGESAEQEGAVISSFLARQVAALLVVPAADADHARLRREQEGGLPLVFLDRPAAGLAADRVLSANREGAEQGTAHLIAHGHRRVAF